MIRLGCLCDAVKQSAGFGPFYRVDDVPGMLADTERSNAPLRVVIVQRQLRIFQKHTKIQFLIYGVVDSLSQFGTAVAFCLLLFYHLRICQGHTAASGGAKHP